MKLIIFSIAVAMYGIQVFGDTPKEAADLLDGKIKGVTKNIETVRGLVNSQIKALSSKDLDIRKEKRIDEVQTALDQKAGKPGIDACKKRFEDAIIVILAAAKETVKHRLSNVLQSLTNFDAVLNPIKSQLSGTALDNELKDCDKDAQKCKLTGEYLTSVKTAWDSVTSINIDMIKPPALIMDKSLSDKIDNDLVKPVNDCLKPL